MPTLDKDSIATTIFLPSALNEKLIAAAKPEKRSRHAQIIYALEKFFETRETNGKKEKSK